MPLSLAVQHGPSSHLYVSIPASMCLLIISLLCLICHKYLCPQPCTSLLSLQLLAAACFVPPFALTNVTLLIAGDTVNILCCIVA